MGISDGHVFASVAVSDISIARDFYGGTLGLAQDSENPGGIGFKSGGGGDIFVYVSDTAGTGKATAAMWEVDDASKVAEELAAKGVTFEHYEMPEMKLVGDVHEFGDGQAKIAWFKDPDGNILGITSGEM